MEGRGSKKLRVSLGAFDLAFPFQSVTLSEEVEKEGKRKGFWLL